MEQKLADDRKDAWNPSLERRSVGIPFERGRTYTVGRLRTFEKDLLAARRSDPSLSKMWRVPTTSAMKLAVKIREETYPLMLFADAKGYSDSATFRLTPFGTSKIDAALTADTETFLLQITIADPTWLLADGSPSNGGYDERLVREALNTDGVVHGLAAMRRRGGVIVCDKPVKSFEEEFDACVRGIENALLRKIDSGSPEIRLLVHARGYCKHVIDFPFARIIEKGIQRPERG
jgi:hypothetical protein